MAALGGNPWDGTEFRNLIRALRSDLLVVRAGITSRWSVMPRRGRLVTQASRHHSVQGGCGGMWGGGGIRSKGRIAGALLHFSGPSPLSSMA